MECSSSSSRVLHALPTSCRRKTANERWATGSISMAKRCVSQCVPPDSLDVKLARVDHCHLGTGVRLAARLHPRTFRHLLRRYETVFAPKPSPDAVAEKSLRDVCGVSALSLNLTPARRRVGRARIGTVQQRDVFLP